MAEIYVGLLEYFSPSIFAPPCHGGYLIFWCLFEAKYHLVFLPNIFLSFSFYFFFSFLSAEEKTKLISEGTQQAEDTQKKQEEQRKRDERDIEINKKIAISMKNIIKIK